ncbi:50S ribosomal protein L25 [Desulfotruncus alcoholivorax]|uniref:50S ribosomal protein L25 n=1 Tax=Desulfotruncus alcoholivorax TaxID=265477 RepID=UPI00040A0EBF|nr:50S ribosomal protein L25 [Desulfotruncus alcoholivorax]
MENVSLQVNYRTKTGKAYRKELIRRGMVPGVVYGKEVGDGGSIPVEVEFKPLKNVLANAKNSIIDLTVQGVDAPKNFKVLIKDMQYDPINRAIMNIDFHQISMKESITTSVAITFNGEIKSGIPQYGIRELQISCLPSNIPAEIAVDLDSLNVGDTVAVRDITALDNVTILDDPDALIVTVLPERKAEEPAGEEPAGTGEGAGAVAAEE